MPRACSHVCDRSIHREDMTDEATQQALIHLILLEGVPAQGLHRAVPAVRFVAVEVGFLGGRCLPSPEHRTHRPKIRINQVCTLGHPLEQVRVQILLSGFGGVLRRAPQQLEVGVDQRLQPAQPDGQQQPHVLGEALRALRGDGRHDVRVRREQRRGVRGCLEVLHPHRRGRSFACICRVRLNLEALQALPHFQARGIHELHQLGTIHGGGADLMQGLRITKPRRRIAEVVLQYRGVQHDGIAGLHNWPVAPSSNYDNRHEETSNAPPPRRHAQQSARGPCPPEQPCRCACCTAAACPKTSAYQIAASAGEHHG
mmetsp:Transcript_6730/g.25260  ORF Transcript_6730/g.25260 Transcript_6730/m.25260 type:complete len:314 (-) Transcript_6730:89-1030(-)